MSFNEADYYHILGRPDEVDGDLVATPLESHDALGGAYDGAERTNRNTALWHAPILPADDEILPQKADMHGRARDVVRNDAFFQNGVALHKNGIVGAKFRLSAKPKFKTLGFDEDWALEFAQEVEEKFALWAESDDNWVDASRRNTFTELIRLHVGVFLAHGEVLSTVEWIRENNRPFHTAIQTIDLDRLSTPPEFETDRLVRGGVRVNRWGAPVGVFIRRAHPFDRRAFSDINEFKFVPMRKPWGRLQVMHTVEQCRPDQTRGVSEMVSALKEYKLTKHFRDIVLQNAVVNATYAAAIESELPTNTLYESLGAGQSENSVQKYAIEYFDSIMQYGSGAKNLAIDGVKIPHLFPGTKLHMHPAGQPGGVGQDFEQSLLRYLAASIGVSYEEFSRDYTSTNYSSARAAMLETWKYMSGRKKIVADRTANSIYKLWLEEAINAGELTTVPRSFPLYDGLNKDAIGNAEWIGASRGQVDEMKETQAAVLRIRSGLSSWEKEAARLGMDWRELFEQCSREQKEIDRLGLKFPGFIEETEPANDDSDEDDAREDRQSARNAGGQ